MGLGGIDPRNGFEREAVVWRWKGYRPDIVRIAGGVIEAAGPGPVSLEVSDPLGLTQFTKLDEFGQGLEAVERFHSVGIIAGAENGPCRVLVFFDAVGSVRESAVTVKTTGLHQESVDRGHAVACRLVSAGAREPKNTKPSEIEQWGVIGGILSAVGGFAGVVFGEAEGGFLLVCLALCLVGLVMMGGAFAYENLIPRIELLRPGQAPRSQRFFLWAGGGIAAALLGSIVTGVVK